MDLLVIPASFVPGLCPGVPLSDPIVTAGTVLYYRSDAPPEGVDGDPALLSALNKALGQIDQSEMQTIILEASVIPERPITLDAIFAQYGGELSALMLLALAGLTAVVLYINRANRALKLLTGEEVLLPDGRCYKAVYSYIYQGGAVPVYIAGKL